MNHQVSLKCIFVLFFFTFSAPSNAALLDQNTLLPQTGFPVGGMRGFVLTPGFGFGQSFAVGVTGQLDRVDIQVGFVGAGAQPMGMLGVSLYRLSADGLPTADAIASAFVESPGPGINDFEHLTLSFDFSSENFDVQAGERYALVTETSSISMNWGIWVDSVGDGTQWISGDRYSGGSGLYRHGDGSWENLDYDPFLAFDLAFATYVTPVPIPGALLLMSSGLFLLSRLRAAR